MQVAISEFKAKCICLLKETADTGEELVVTLRGRPLVRVVGLTPQPTRLLGGQPDALDPETPDRILIESDLENDWTSDGAGPKAIGDAPSADKE
jgi:prevent-host-death family protein